MASMMEQTQDDFRPTSSSSTCSTSNCKSVQFSRFIKISFTYPGDEYDRSALEPAKLTSSEASELLELRCHWRQEMSERQGAHKQDIMDREDPESPLPTMQSHPCNSRHLHHTHSLLKCASPTCSHSSPPCSPVLSHQDSCSSSSDDDEYDPVLSSQRSLPSLKQQQQQLRFERFGGSRDGMMHRHSHLDQSKENVQCLA
ncbi:hypothetical protein BGX28_003916 [Mortierella sp. GBA30]|nr:hypothetical protein BGX28_003916 [Mortierella sp. GBA30]